MQPSPTAETSSPWPSVLLSIVSRLPTGTFGHSRSMFDHVGMRVSDREASRRFYETVLSVLGIRLDHSSELYDEWDDFSIMAAEDVSTVTRGLHVGFPAASREKVDEFWRVGVDAGYRSDGEPGPRPEYGDDYYGGFLLDPDGNSAEAVHYAEKLRDDGTVDHLWIRVRDVAASKRLYELVAPFGRFEQRFDSPERAMFAGGTASFSVVAGPPTTNLHLAFPADDNGT